MNNTGDFTDLVLLVGTNPLPNYVVARYFLSPHLQRIWLVYSEKTDFYRGTGQYADNIQQVLEKQLAEINYDVNFFKCELSNIGQARAIYEEMCNHLEKRLTAIAPSSTFHLNYTGGTKAMAVHVYRAMEHRIDSDDLSCSYLDARDFHIKFDKTMKETDDLRPRIDLKIEDLFALHNYTYKVEKSDYLSSISREDRERILQGITTLANNNLIYQYKNWAKEATPLFEKSKQENYINIIENRLIDFNPAQQSPLFSLLAAFPDNDKLADEEGNWIYDRFGISGKTKNSKVLENFLTGKWLEAYVAWILQTKIEEHAIQHSRILTNYYLFSKEVPAAKEFEIDVLATNGYQICGISCGTPTSQKTIKQKGFEVILRSKQMGGDEARSALVTLLDSKTAKKVQSDLLGTTGTEKSNFIVLGQDDLAVDILWEKISQHIYD